MNFIIDWINLEVGIIMGCAVSLGVFVLAMKVILKVVLSGTGLVNTGNN